MVLAASWKLRRGLSVHIAHHHRKGVPYRNDTCQDSGVRKVLVASCDLPLALVQCSAHCTCQGAITILHSITDLISQGVVILSNLIFRSSVRTTQHTQSLQVHMDSTTWKGYQGPCLSKRKEMRIKTFKSVVAKTNRLRTPRKPAPAHTSSRPGDTVTSE